MFYLTKNVVCDGSNGFTHHLSLSIMCKIDLDLLSDYWCFTFCGACHSSPIVVIDLLFL